MLALRRIRGSKFGLAQEGGPASRPAASSTPNGRDLLVPFDFVGTGMMFDLQALLHDMRSMLMPPTLMLAVSSQGLVVVVIAEVGVCSNRRAPSRTRAGRRGTAVYAGLPYGRQLGGGAASRSKLRLSAVRPSLRPGSPAA